MRLHLIYLFILLRLKSKRCRYRRTIILMITLRFFLAKNKKLIARQLRKQYVECIYNNSVTVKSGSEITQGHWK